MSGTWNQRLTNADAREQGLLMGSRFWRVVIDGEPTGEKVNAYGQVVRFNSEGFEGYKPTTPVTFPPGRNPTQGARTNMAENVYEKEQRKDRERSARREANRLTAQAEQILAREKDERKREKKAAKAHAQAEANRVAADKTANEVKRQRKAARKALDKVIANGKDADVIAAAQVLLETT